MFPKQLDEQRRITASDGVRRPVRVLIHGTASYSDVAITLAKKLINGEPMAAHTTVCS